MKNVSTIVKAQLKIKSHEKSNNARLCDHSGKSGKMSTGLTNLLSDFIASGQTLNYETASKHLYGSKAGNHRNKMYQLAHRLEEEAVHEIAKQDLTATMRNKYDANRYSTYRNLLVADTLYLKGSIDAAALLWEKTAMLARTHHLTQEGLKCADRLSYYYSVTDKPVKRRMAQRTLEVLLAALHAEIEASLLYQSMITSMSNQFYFDPKLKRKSSASCNRIGALAHRHRTHSLWLALYRTRIFDNYILRDYKALLNTCRNYRQYLEHHPRLQQNALWLSISHHEINACICLRQFTYGIRMIDETKKYLHPDNPNWISYHENYFQLFMHAQRYEKAQEIYQQVITSRHGRTMNPYQKDVWKIYGACLHFAFHDTKQVNRFNPRHYFNSVSKSYNDKKGLYFLMQALKLMHLFMQDDEHLAEANESFRQYCQRHISRKKNYRSYLFSKMLLLVFKYDGDLQKAEQTGKKFYQRLLEFKDHTLQDREITEIIPYEHLWYMLLRQLNQRQTRIAA